MLAVTLGEYFGIVGSSILIFGAIIRQSKRIKKGIEYQIKLTRDNKKEIEEIKKKIDG